MDAIVYDKVGKEAEKVREALYGIYPQETITDAAITSFDDGADGIPVKALTVGIEPVQDLHGYDSPWPAGGGVNKFDVESVSSPSFTINNGTFTNTSTDTRTNFQLVVQQYNNGAYVKSVGAYSVTNTGRTFTKISGIEAGITSLRFKHNGSSADIIMFDYPWTATDDLWISFTVVSNNPSIVGGLVISDIQLEIATAGSTQASAYAPYSNICPISGWTGAEISGTGINLWDEEWELGRFDTTTGANVSSTTQIRSKNFIPLKGGAEYYLKTPIAVWIIFFDKDKNPVPPPDYSWASINGKSVHIGNRVFQAPDSACYCRFYCLNDYGTTYNNDIGINYPATDTEYHTYTGNQISVNWETEAGTVYGGTLTLNPDRTGTLVVDKAMLTATGTEAWTASSNLVSRCCNLVIPDMKIGSFLYCNLYEFVSTLPPVSDRYGKIMTIYNSALSYNVIGVGYNAGETVDLDGFKAFLSENPLQVVYELASPRTYQLTAEQVSGILETIYGQNNIWASTGNIEELTYRADLGKYIDSHITTAVANALNA